MGRQLTYCVCRDITERRRAEEERLRLVTIVEASSDLIAISDAIGRITYINRAGRAMLGIPRDRLLEKTYIRDYHPQWAYDIVARVGIPHAEKEGVWLGDTALRRQDDSELPVSQLIIVHKNRSGNVEFISTIARDITSRLETERQLREADRRKDEFLAMLAHELRNPLAPICNAVEILKDSGDSATMIAWCREVVQRQTEHLCRLVDDLLEVSRISRGKIVLKRRPTDVVDVLQRAVETNRPVIHARRIELSVQSPAEPLWVDGDIVRLVQVVSNLLNNAAKYTRTGGEVRLSAARDGDRVIIRVTDTGQGIDPPALPHLFDLFYQADQTLDRSRGGLGIGLSLVKNLVELHGGRVQAYSEGRDRGSEFVVSLPLLTDPAAQPSSDEIEATRAAAKSRILIVDDNRDSAESMAVLLRQWGHDVLTAHDGHEGLKRAFSVRPDALLLDIGLPGLNGYEVCRQARLGGLDTALIIAVTGYADQGSLQQSREAGFDAHLAKPVRLSLLQELLADHRPLTAPANPEAG
jgi:PAS domain S-box-containing protein